MLDTRKTIKNAKIATAMVATQQKEECYNPIQAKKFRQKSLFQKEVPQHLWLAG